MTLNNRLHDQHISFNLHEDVKSICAPLFLTTDINYFHYGRVYPDGHSLVLITHPEFHKFFWEHEYDKVVFKNYQFEGWFINKSCSNELLHSAKHYFNVDNWLLHIKNKHTYVESFGFGTYAGNDAILDYYLNHQDKLEAFCLYFKESAKNLIDLSTKSLLYTDGLDLSHVLKTEDHVIDKSSDLLKTILVNNKYLVENSLQEIVGITKCEFLILHYTSTGLSAKMTAKLMNISYRTVEVHLQQIKEKFNAKNKSDLIRMYTSIFKGTIPSIETIIDIFSADKHAVNLFKEDCL